jgi:CheY-like chemotaxis protein
MANQRQDPRAQVARPLRILLVEDHEDTLHLMMRVLELSGHTVKPETTIAGALHAATSHTFDCVISDLGLPDGSGIDLIRQLLAHGPVKSIALTGAAELDNADECLEAGFTKHLTKPVDLKTLEATLRDLC